MAGPGWSADWLVECVFEPFEPFEPYNNSSLSPSMPLVLMRVIDHSSFNCDISSPHRYTYLDSQLNGGRPVVVLKAHNLVDEHAKKKIEISYTFQQTRMAVEPLMLVASFLLFFLVCSVVKAATLEGAEKVSVGTAVGTASAASSSSEGGGKEVQ